jgi:phage/plasmid-associated DNA primase
MQTVWGLEYVHKQEIATIIREMELDPTTPPVQIAKYLVCLEFVFHERKDLMFLLEHVYIPQQNVIPIVLRIDMNIGFLDMCTAQEFAGTLFVDFDETEHMGRVERLSKLTTQAGNVAKLSQAYGTDSIPEMLSHPTPENLDREWKPQQKLLNFLMQRAGDQRLRRKNAAFYRPRLLPDNTHTGFYEYDREITDFIFQAVSPARMHPEFYDALTNKPSTPQQMINLLTSLPDPRSPFLEKDRTLFSYANGVFNAVDGTFTTYADRVHNTKSTSNFFDFVMTPELLSMDPMDIETPNFEKILADQDLDPCARRWMYSLCGRLLHNVGQLDDWQVTLYIRGVAGSGKSSILKVMQMMYEACDTGFMMSDGQVSFCDEHLYDKHIVMAMDLDKQTLFSATRINSMTSGERLSINRKFKTALNTEWKPPMAMASNAQPPWDDVAGNLVRRFVIFTFNHPVRVSDPHLFTRLKQEVPLLLVKMARAYLASIRDYGHGSLWAEGVLPKMCHDAKRQYLVSSNPLSAFLASDQVVFQPHVETDAADFRRALMLFTKEFGDRRSPTIGIISKVDHGHLFAMYGCMITERVTSSGTVRTVITGMSMVDAAPL